MTGLTMTRQSISLTDPNDSWLKDQIEKQEFSSKSELINALVRKARHEDERQAYITQKLALSEERIKREGYCTQTPEEILAELKAEALKDGLL